jgi:hypothetical protein
MLWWGESQIGLTCEKLEVMNGCSLDDAFPMDDGAPSPGCQQPYSSKEARKEERRKAKKCRGPPMAFLDVKDPDRQHLNKVPEVPAMNPSTGLREHVPVDAPVGYEPFANYVGSMQGREATEPFSNPSAEQFQSQNFIKAQNKIVNGFQGGPNASPYQGCDYSTDLMCQRLREVLPRTDDDPVGNKVRSTIPFGPAEAASASARASAQKKKSYFGADPEDGFADYSPDAANFLMEPTIENGFGIGSAPAAALPVPSVSDYWKPLTPAGVETSFFNTLPAPGGRYVKQDKVKEKVPQWEEPSINRKIDQIMARLDDLQRRNSGSPEQAQTEIMLFVSSGIFVLFLMDLLVKKGGKLF